MKIFGIGSHKTGTTTLERCLDILGYLPQAAWANSSHLTDNWANNDYNPILYFAQNYVSFSDSPWNHTDFYKMLDWAFPGSKFILTTRNPDSWFDSLRRWCTPKDLDRTSIGALPYGRELHLAAYNMVEDSFDDYEDHYKIMFERRNFEIQRYFKDRPHDLLVLDWTKHGWKELCNFLGKPIPSMPIPQLNVGKK